MFVGGAEEEVMTSTEKTTMNQAAAATSTVAKGEEKVFVALPAEFKAGWPTLGWVLRQFRGSGATVVVTHVHVPPQMIPVMGVNFHASKVSPDTVSSFRRTELENVNRLLDDYVHQCFRMKVKCEKLVVEKDDVVAGLVELIALHGITKLVISAAKDKHYSSNMDKPKSRTATKVMLSADPSCKIWFVCKQQLICTRGQEVDTAAAVTPFVPNTSQDALVLSPHQAQDYDDLEFGFDDALKEASKVAEDLMKRVLCESFRRQKADEEVASCLQKVKVFEDLYFEEVKKRKELEGDLVRANREIALLKQDKQQSSIMEELQDEITDKVILGQQHKGEIGKTGRIRPQQDYVQLSFDHDNGVRKLEEFFNNS